MDNFLELLKSDAFLIIVLLISIISIILLIVNYVKLNRINKNYSEFMKKVGNGKNIDETLKSYMEDVQKVDKLNKEILNYCENLDKTVDNCIQKIGLVRYNAFKDVGSDLSFTLAIGYELNRKGCKCLCVCPGPTSSNFFAAAGFDSPPLPGGFGHVPLEVAIGAYTALAKGKNLKVIGLLNSVQAALVRLFPINFVLSMSGFVLKRVRKL